MPSWRSLLPILFGASSGHHINVFNVKYFRSYISCDIEIKKGRSPKTSGSRWVPRSRPISNLTEEEKAPTQDAHNAEKCEVPDPGADPPPHRHQLDHYKREHRGPVDDWAGLYEPADEGSTDPEAMNNWRISYIIEKI